MTVQKTIDEFRRWLGENGNFIEHLRESGQDFAVDMAIGLSPRWLTDDDARYRLNLVFGPKVPKMVVGIARALHFGDKKQSHENLQHCFRVLAFVLGENRLKLCAMAVTSIGAVSD